LGQISEAEVISVLRESDVYLSTSCAEGLSNSVAEACCVSLPCVVFDCEGMRELIDDEKTGYIVEFGNIGALSERIKRLNENTALAVEMGKRARAKMIAEFDESTWVNKMMEFYNRTLMKTTNEERS